MELVNLTKYLVSELLPGVNDISVEKIETDGNTVIQVLVPNDCMSIIIGKGGSVANSLRTIVQAAAYVKKLGKVRINIDSK